MSLRRPGTRVMCVVMSLMRHFERERKFGAVKAGLGNISQHNGTQTSLKLRLEEILEPSEERVKVTGVKM